MYLPPYSTGSNPNEELLAKLKALAREVDAHTKEAFWTIIEKCWNYLGNCRDEPALL